MIEQMHDYIARGWKVFPVHEPKGAGCSCAAGVNCETPAKHPRTDHGHNDASDKAAMVQFWGAKFKGCNWGIATGAVSGFIVVDVDGAKGFESLKRLFAEHGTPAERYWTRTGGGGWHLLFKHPGFFVKTTNSKQKAVPAFGPGIDIKGDGGYIVAPPSLHVSGNVYEWGSDLPAEIPDAPEWLLAKLRENSAGPAVVLDGEGGEKIPKGGRNNVLTSLAGTMRRRGLDGQEIYAALAAVNDRRCEPPLSEADVRKIAHSVSRYAPEDPVFIYPEKTTMDGERPEGVFFVREFADEIRDLYDQGMKGGLSTGIPSLDWHYTVKPGQWTVVTGIPGHGKSALLDCLLYNLAELHGWKIAVTSIENQPLQRHAAALMSLWAGEAFGKGDAKRMSRETREDALRWLDEHFVFILPAEGECSVNGILDRVAWVDSQAFFTNGVVIDPWNELEHRRPANMTETEYVSHSLTRIRHFSRTREKHLWLVAHPTKLSKDVKSGNYPVPTLYDISGSSHFRNKADMGLSVWRDVMAEGTPTQVHIQKVRFRECGKPGMVELYFDVTNGRFTETRPVYFPEYESVEEEPEKW